MGRLEGRVAIVTGAGRGIGREHALLLGREGAAVVVDDVGARAGADADSVAAEIRGMGGNAVSTSASATWDGADGMSSVPPLIFLGHVDGVVNNADRGPQ